MHVLEEHLRKIGNEVLALANAIAASNPSQPDQPEVAIKTVSFDEVRGILAKAAHDGHRKEVKELVLSHGADSLSAYKDQPDVLAALVKEVEALNA